MQRIRAIGKLLFAAALLAGAACTPAPPADTAALLDPLAERYVRLALALGEHDADYVDAYFGPAAWREQAREQQLPLEDIAAQADAVAAALHAIDVSNARRLVVLRYDYLRSYVESLATVARMRAGLELSFDEESRRIYGFVAPSFPVEHYAGVLAELDAVLPGEGPLYDRLEAFRLQFEVPADKIEAVITAGIEECRKRTREHIELPRGESFELEFVTGNPWGAYNWYKGNAHSLIQIETSLPIEMSRAITLGCHEGYPGHHTFSSLLEERFLRQRGWVEFSILPLFSPQGVIFEGSGDFAEKLAFPGASHAAFLEEVVRPLAGLPPVDFETAARVSELRRKIRYAGIEAARHYRDGDWDRAQTAAWLTEYALVPAENVDSWFAFAERYGAYSINYVLGEDLVEDYVRARNPDDDARGNWQVFAELLSLPPTPLVFAEP